METQALQLLDGLRDLDERIRALVAAGQIEDLEGLILDRGTSLELLETSLRAVPERSHALQNALDVFHRTDCELIDWMIHQKASIAESLASLRLEGQDPYREHFVGSAVLDQRR